MNIPSCTVVLKLLDNLPNDFSCGGMLLTVSGRTIQLSPISLKIPLEASLSLVLCTKKEDLSIFELKKTANRQTFNASDDFLGENFSALIVYSLDGKFTPCMFGKNGKSEMKMGEMLNFYAQNCKKTEQFNSQKTYTVEIDVSNGNAEKEIQTGEQSNDQRICSEEQDICVQANDLLLENENTTEGFYNDEEIAEENYFELAEEDVTPMEIENAQLHNQIDGTENHCKSEREEEENANATQQYDASPCDNAEQTGTWYNENVKQKIEEIFNKYPPISALTDIIPQSKWAKIPYAENRFYIVGTVSENNSVKYVVYGVPGEKSHPPKGFERYSRFIPESIFDLDAKGYWCIFQNAKDGMNVCLD